MGSRRPPNTPKVSSDNEADLGSLEQWLDEMFSRCQSDPKQPPGLEYHRVFQTIKADAIASNLTTILDIDQLRDRIYDSFKTVDDVETYWYESSTPLANIIRQLRTRYEVLENKENMLDLAVEVCVRNTGTNSPFYPASFKSLALSAGRALLGWGGYQTASSVDRPSSRGFNRKAILMPQEDREKFVTLELEAAKTMVAVARIRNHLENGRAAHRHLRNALQFCHPEPHPESCAAAQLLRSLRRSAQLGMVELREEQTLSKQRILSAQNRKWSRDDCESWFREIEDRLSYTPSIAFAGERGSRTVLDEEIKLLDSLLGPLAATKAFPPAYVSANRPTSTSATVHVDQSIKRDADTLLGGVNAALGVIFHVKWDLEGNVRHLEDSIRHLDNCYTSLSATGLQIEHPFSRSTVCLQYAEALLDSVEQQHFASTLSLAKDVVQTARTTADTPHERLRAALFIARLRLFQAVDGHPSPPRSMVADASYSIRRVLWEHIETSRCFAVSPDVLSDAINRVIKRGNFVATTPKHPIETKLRSISQMRGLTCSTVWRQLQRAICPMLAYARPSEEDDKREGLVKKISRYDDTIEVGYEDVLSLMPLVKDLSKVALPVNQRLDLLASLCKVSENVAEHKQTAMGLDYAKSCQSAWLFHTWKEQRLREVIHRLMALADTWRRLHETSTDEKYLILAALLCLALSRSKRTISSTKDFLFRVLFKVSVQCYTIWGPESSMYQALCYSIFLFSGLRVTSVDDLLNSQLIREAQTTRPNMQALSTARRLSRLYRKDRRKNGQYRVEALASLETSLQSDLPVEVLVETTRLAVELFIEGGQRDRAVRLAENFLLRDPTLLIPWTVSWGEFIRNVETRVLRKEVYQITYLYLECGGDPTKAVLCLESWRRTPSGNYLQMRQQTENVDGEEVEAHLSTLMACRREVERLDKAPEKVKARASWKADKAKADAALEAAFKDGQPNGALQSLLDPLNQSDLVEVAKACGNLVLLIPEVSMRGCYAVILRDNHGELSTKALYLDGSGVDGTSGLLSETIKSFATFKPSTYLQSQEEMIIALSTLWDLVVGPILRYIPRSQRVTWIGLGALAGLPFHAACHDGDRTRDTLLKVVSSYAPSIRVLKYALDVRERKLKKAKGCRVSELRDVLLAGMSQPPRLSLRLRALPDAGREIQALAELLSANHHTHVIYENELCTLATILAAMDLHIVFHYAGHSSNGPDPSGRGLHLHDGILTVEKLAGKTVAASAGALLAVLLGCHSATTPKTLTDEAVNPAGAMILSGFPSAVGCLWAAEDTRATIVSRFFYSELARNKMDTKRSPEALNAATLELRRSTRKRSVYQRVRTSVTGTAPASQPYLWAGYVHMGVW